MESLFGDSKLLKKDGSLAAPSEVLAGKEYVLLYFSAHWCGPCQMFTPKLAEWYLKQGAERKMEVVFVSADQDEDEYKEYFGGMPWVALPYGDSQIEPLNERFKVRGIPAVVVLRADGTLVTTKGTRGFRSDPDAFPWAPAFPVDTPLRTVLESVSQLVDCNGNTFAPSTLRNRHRWALYFSASWCGPCHEMMPKLRAFYENVRKTHPDFEIVYVTWDEEEAAWQNFFKEHPWKAIRLSEPKFGGLKDWLNDTLEVSGIPCLVVLDENCNVITSDGTALVEGDPTGARYPWPPAPCVSLPEIARDLNQFPCFVAFADAIDETKAPHLVARVHELTNAVSQPYFVDNKQSSKIRFAVADKGSSVLPRVRQVFGLDIVASIDPSSEQAALFTIINVPGRNKSIWPQARGIPSQEALSQWVRDFVENKSPNTMELDESIDPAVVEAKRKKLEEFKTWPETVTVPDHPHPLEKRATVYRGFYGCDVCKKDGRGFVYHCDACGWDAHPACVHVGIADAGAGK